MNPKRLLLYAFIFFGLVTLSNSQNVSTREDIISKIDSVIAHAIRSRAFPGAVLLIGTGDSILFHKAYGYHTYDSSRKVQSYHLYDLASVTKVTAGTLALMKLYEDGLLHLDDPLRDYVSGFRLNRRGKTTLRRLLTHSAGWQSWVPYYVEMIRAPGSFKPRYFSNSLSEKYSIQIADSLFFRTDGYRTIKKEIKKADLSSNNQYVYSGLFSYLIPELVEKATGENFESFLYNEFYQPLEASTLVFNPLNKFPDSMIVPTEIDTFFRMEPIHGTVHDEGAILMGGVSSNAGLFGSALDVYKVWNIFLKDGQMDTTSLLKEATIDLFTTAQYPNEDNRRGLGFDKPLLVYDEAKSSVSKLASQQSFGHSGYTGPLVWADPSKDLVFVFLCNRVYPNRMQRKIYELNIRPILHMFAYSLRETAFSGYLE